MICPRCGAPIQQGGAVCSNCGLPLQWGPAAPQQQPAPQSAAYQAYQQAPQPGYQQAPYPPQMYQQTPPSGGNSKLWLWILLGAIAVVAIIIGVVIGTRGGGDKPTTKPTLPAPTTSQVVPPTTKPVPSITAPATPTKSYPSVSLPAETSDEPTASSTFLNTIVGSFTNIMTFGDYETVEFKDDGTVTLVTSGGVTKNGTYKILSGDVSAGLVDVEVGGETIRSEFDLNGDILFWNNQLFLRDS